MKVADDAEKITNYEMEILQQERRLQDVFPNNMLTGIYAHI